MSSAPATASGAGGGGTGGQPQGPRSPPPSPPPQQMHTRCRPRLLRPDSDSADEMERGEEERRRDAKAQPISYARDHRPDFGEDPVTDMSKRERRDYHVKHGLCFRCGKHGHFGKDHDLGGRLYLQQQQLQRREIAAAVLGTTRGTAAGGDEEEEKPRPPHGRGRARGDPPSRAEKGRQAGGSLDIDADRIVAALAKQQVAVWEGDVAREDDRLAEGVGFGFAGEAGPLSVRTETGTPIQTQRQRTWNTASTPRIGLRRGSGRGPGRAQPQSTPAPEVAASGDTANADAHPGSRQRGRGGECRTWAGDTGARGHGRERESSSSSSHQQPRSRRSQMQLASDRWVAAQPVPLLDAPVMDSGLRGDADVDAWASGFGSCEISPGASLAVEVPERGMGITSGPGLGLGGVSASEDLLGLDLDASPEQQRQGGGTGLDELMGLDLGGSEIDSALGEQQGHPSTGEVGGGGAKALMELDLAFGQVAGKDRIGAVREDEPQEHDEEDESEEVGDEDGDGDGDGDDGIVVFRGRGKVEDRDLASRDDG